MFQYDFIYKTVSGPFSGLWTSGFSNPDEEKRTAPTSGHMGQLPLWKEMIQNQTDLTRALYTTYEYLMVINGLSYVDFHHKSCNDYLAVPTMLILVSGNSDTN